MKVRARTPSRLHLGIIDLNGDLGRLFGGLGVALRHPSILLEVKPSENLEVIGPRSREVRLQAERFFRHFGLPGKAQIILEEDIPRHVGLGSGTQLSLAVAVSLAKLSGLKADVLKLAKIMGRGSFSGVGTGVFKHGGFVLEGGQSASRRGEGVDHRTSMPPIILHHPFPARWRFVVATPNVRRGFTDEEEKEAFRSLEPAPPERVGRICRLLVMAMLPSLVERDIRGFGTALTEIQEIVGDCFAGVQGGRFRTPVVGECISHMLSNGAYGAGQSSWGPTVYGLVNGDGEAEDLRRKVEAFLDRRGGGKVFFTGADNSGARVEISQ